MDVMQGCTVDENGDYVMEVTVDSMLETAKREGYSPAEIESLRRFFEEAAPPLH